MQAQLITITELSVKPDQEDKAAAAWLEHHEQSAVKDRVLYQSLDGSTLMELAATSSTFKELGALREDWIDLWNAVGSTAESDFSRQLLQFVEAPKPIQTALPQTPYVQLRHVEVPPPVYGAYRAWREETIFDVVRTSPEVDAFVAYDSVFSTEPGVMFVSGFSCSPDKYGEVFSSARYQDIVRQAGDRYITGGDRGLYTKIYARLTAPAAPGTWGDQA